MWKKKEQYYIVGTSGVDNSYGYLIKYDSSGNVIWAKDVGGYYGITSVK